MTTQNDITPEQELAIEAMRKMYEHEPMLSREDKAKHMAIEEARILKKPTTKVDTVTGVPLHERTDGWKGRNGR